MEEIRFPIPDDELMGSLTTLMAHQDGVEEADIVSQSRISVAIDDYDGYGGRVVYWRVSLVLPIHVYASLGVFEKSVQAKAREALNRFLSAQPGHEVSAVIVSPAFSAKYVPSQSSITRKSDHIWQEGRFRIFLSHVSAHKRDVALLKGSLAAFGCAAFVAHEDIQPSSEWLEEIQLALMSMDCLVAVLTTDFHASTWTDQEVGFAFGRGVVVVPVRIDIQPYGLMGKIQSVYGSFKASQATAEAIVGTLLKNKSTRPQMKRALVHAFAESTSFQTSIMLKAKILELQDLTIDEKEIIRDSVVRNDQVGKAHGVPEAIYDHVGKPIETFQDDDTLPF